MNVRSSFCYSNLEETGLSHLSGIGSHSFSDHSRRSSHWIPISLHTILATLIICITLLFASAPVAMAQSKYSGFIDTRLASESFRSLDINKYLKTKKEQRIFEEGIVLYRQGHYRSAYKNFTEIINFPPARYFVAQMLHKGLGVAQDYEKAFKNYKQLSDIDFVPAIYMVGLYYENGYFVEQNFETAATYYTRAVEEFKNDESARALGGLYFRGAGVSQDYSKSLSLYTFAAEKGNVRAAYNLGLMYEKGIGTAPDAMAALHWFTVSAEKGDDKAMYRLGHMYENREAERYDPAQAAKWYESAVVAGNIEAMIRLAEMYRYGQGVERDYESALALYGRAAKADNAAAAFAIGEMFEQGEGVEVDASLAAQWYRIAAKVEFPDAQFRLGLMYIEGVGVEQDAERGMELVRQAAAQFFAPALAYLKKVDENKNN